MDMAFSIAELSMSMKAAQFSQQVSVSMAKKTMDTAEASMTAVLEMLPSIDPAVGQRLDAIA